MTYEEIETLLKNKGLESTLHSLQNAVENEKVVLNPREMDRAREYIAEDITRALEDGNYLTPEGALSHRERYVVAWAIAEIMKREKALPEGIEVKAAENPTQTLTKLCIANAELGNRCVELMLRCDDKDAIIEQLRGIAEQGVAVDVDLERAVLVMAKIRQAAGLQVGDGVSLVARVVELAADRLTGAKNLCWMAEKIHQSFHDDVDGADAHATWRECKRGVCGSMEHMLAQVGLDKDLKESERRP